MDRYIERDITQELTILLKEYPVVTILGPRQAGKTTLARKVGSEYRYVNLEVPETRAFAAEDPTTFLRELGGRVILDEIQRVPLLLSYIQAIVDDAQGPGQFILTGSHQLELNATISQSLAGRTALLHLLPLSMQELRSAQILDKDFPSISLRGSLPRVFSQNQRSTTAYANYFQTYVDRDVRQLIMLKDVGLFEKFMKLLAGRVGQPVNYSSLGSDVGVDQKTIQSWLSILEASYIIFRLPPYFENFGKRVLKAPKCYFVDVGLLVYLLGLEEDDQVRRDPLVGAIFENLVIGEVLKARFNRGKEGNIYFFRDSGGTEVDLLVPARGSNPALALVEIKSGATFSPSFTKGIDSVRRFTSSELAGYVVYSGETRKLNGSTALLNFSESSILGGL